MPSPTTRTNWSLGFPLLERRMPAGQQRPQLVVHDRHRQLPEAVRTVIMPTCYVRPMPPQHLPGRPEQRAQTRQGLPDQLLTRLQRHQRDPGDQLDLQLHAASRPTWLGFHVPCRFSTAGLRPTCTLSGNDRDMPRTSDRAPCWGQMVAAVAIPDARCGTVRARKRDLRSAGPPGFAGHLTSRRETCRCP